MKLNIGVLALQGDVIDHQRALEACSTPARQINVTRVRRPSELEQVDGLVLPGGESTTIDKLLRIFELREPLRARIAAGLPVYGSCAGMILLADELVEAHRGQQTLGGIEMTVRRNAFGRQVDSFEEDLTVEGLAEPVHAVFIRAPWVERVGERVQVLARSSVEGNPVVAVRQGNLLATSFHPEITGDHRVHGLFVDLVAKA